MTDWALALIPLREAHCLLDIGCGGGAALNKLSVLAPEADLHGVDYSATSLEIAERTNRQLIGQGRITLHEADVARLPFEDGRFDLAVTIESHFFWPELRKSLAEVLRVLRPGGRLAVVSGAYLGGRHDWRNRKLAAKGRMNCHTLPELSAIMREAGYDDVLVHEQHKKGWCCLIGSNPAGEARSGSAQK
jgi:SAM-dependent methyltransferase